MENVKQTERLNEYRSKISFETAHLRCGARKGEPEFADVLVSILLRQVAEDFGSDEADAIIRQYGLDKMGWEVKGT